MASFWIKALQWTRSGLNHCNNLVLDYNIATHSSWMKSYQCRNMLTIRWTLGLIFSTFEGKLFSLSVMQLWSCSFRVRQILCSCRVKPKIIKLEFVASRIKTVHEEKMGKQWLAWYQDNMSEWIGMMFSWNNIAIFQLNVLVIHSTTWFDFIWYWMQDIISKYIVVT